MKTLLAIVLSVVCLTAHAVEVVSTGRGTTEDSAIASAERQAADQVAGTFLIGKTTVNDDSVHDRIEQYSGAVIRHYEKVSSVFKDGLFTVIIKADVDEKKVNEVVTSASASVSDDMRDKVATSRKSMETLSAAIKSVNSMDTMLATKVTAVEYDAHGVSTRVTVKFDVVLSPKWYDDMYSVAKMSSELGMSEARDFGVCFVGDRRFLIVSIACYDMHQSLDLEQQLNYNVYVKTSSDTEWYVMNGLLNMSALYVRGQYNTSQRGMFLYKNGIIHAESVFDISSKTLESVEGFEVKL